MVSDGNDRRVKEYRIVRKEYRITVYFTLQI